MISQCTVGYILAQLQVALSRIYYCIFIYGTVMFFFLGFLYISYLDCNHFSSKERKCQIIVLRCAEITCELKSWANSLTAAINVSVLDVVVLCKPESAKAKCPPL